MVVLSKKNKIVQYIVIHIHAYSEYFIVHDIKTACQSDVLISLQFHEITTNHQIPGKIGAHCVSPNLIS